VVCEKATGAKCERCWTFSEQVNGPDTLCERCTEVLAHQ